MTVHTQTPARAARRQLLVDRFAEYLAEKCGNEERATGYDSGHTVWWGPVGKDRHPRWSGLDQLPTRLRLLVDGETGTVVP